MSIYLDQKLQVSQEGFTRHELISWHNRLAILAVTSYNESFGSEINFFHEDGQRTSYETVRKAGFRVCCLSWHPEKRVLAVGYTNGDVALCLMEENVETVQLPASPTASISCLEWSSNGLRLLVADTSGEVLVHKIDHRGHPHSTPYSQNKLKEPVKCAVLKPAHGLSLFGLAESPDSEDTLDMFSRRRLNESNSSNFLSHAESSTFFLGGTEGGVFCLRENGTINDSFRADKPVFKMFYFTEKDRLLTFTEDMILYQHSVDHDCHTDEQLRVKLSGKLPNFDIIWMNGILAMSSGDNQVRLWDLHTEENCILPLTQLKGYATNDNVQTMAYCSARSVLAASLVTGQIAMWKRSRSSTETELEEQWKLQSPAHISGLIICMRWAPNRSVLAVCTPKDIFMLREQTMLAHFNEKYAAIQTGSSSIAVTRIEKFVTTDLRPELKQIGGLYVTDRCIAVWDGTKVIIFELGNSGDAVVVGSFQCMTQVVGIREQNVYTLEPDRLQVRTYQGTVKQILSLSEIEGDPMILDISDHFLSLGTSTGFIKIFDLSRREARQQFHPKYISEGIRDFAKIESIRVNSSGNKVSCTIRRTDRTIDPRLYIWDAEADTVMYFNFESGLSDQQEYDAADAMNLNDDPLRSVDLAGRSPRSHFWDTNDPRLFICEAIVPEYLPPQMIESYIVGFFVTSDFGILIQDAFPKSNVAESLIGLEVPNIYFTKKADTDFPTEKHQNILEKLVTRYLVRRVFREFIGLENADPTTKEAMLNFSFYLTIGNMDEAFKAIKLIKSESVWENMAQMCVKTQRLDVAAVCLGNMGHARGARSLRRAMRQEKETEVKVATLAIHLGLVDEAATLYRSCGRHDLLNRLLQTTNQWKVAFEIAQKYDRIHLRNTYYNYAGHLESIGAIEGAIDNYEKSDTNRFEIPRMLFDDPMILEQYVKKKKDSYLQKWWAQYLESLGEMETARSYYRSAGDFLSVVRICCYVDDIDQAASVANESGDKAACYHLARQYENDGQISAAVHFFSKAHAYSSAIRLAKEHGLEDKIAQLSLMSNEGDMIEAAKFYENKPGQADKAVMLYHKAGMFGRALDLAFRTEQFSALDLIASDLDENSDPRVLERCAEFFAQNHQYSKAVQLLAYAKQYKEAINLCLEKNVPISEQLAESLTPPKDIIPNAVERNHLLEQIADCCMQQGLYHYAAKKYTQAGSKTEAMRALLKSGDTEKIMFFADTARSKDIYVMAANYLQTVDWKENPDIMKKIVTFYSKGQALERLAGFYDSCAQVEIDDYRDYEKASSALQEAIRCLTKVEGREVIQTQEMADKMNKKITLIKKFLNIRTIYEADPVDAMQQLQTLAKETEVNDAVRLGDIYAVLIIHNVKKNNFKKAHSYVDELKGRMPNLDLTRYVKPQILDTIYRELNIEVHEIVDTPDIDDEMVPESVTLKRRMNQNDNSILNGDDIFT